jgi:hypothetical protein
MPGCQTEVTSPIASLARDSIKFAEVSRRITSLNAIRHVLQRHAVEIVAAIISLALHNCNSGQIYVYPRDVSTIAFIYWYINTNIYVLRDRLTLVGKNGNKLKVLGLTRLQLSKLKINVSNKSMSLFAKYGAVII